MPRGTRHTVCFQLLLLCACAGCAPSLRGGPTAEGPFTAAAVQQRWATQATTTSDGSGPALTVETAIHAALAASPELEQIRQRVEAAREQVRQADAVFYPRVIFTESFNVTDNPVLAFMNVLNQRQLQSNSDFNNPGQQQNVSSRIAGDWSVFEGGSRWFGRSAAANQRQSVEAELLAAHNRLVATVTETYYRWLQALDFIHVAEAALHAARTDEELGASRVKAEVALPSELLRLKTQTAEQHGNLVSARTRAGRMQAALERLIARPIRPQEVPQASPAGAVLAMTGPSQETATLVDQALQSRPELSAVRALVQAAVDRVRAAEGQLVPSIGAQSWYQWDSEDLSGGGTSWMFAVQATWPLFQGGLTLSRISQAQANLKELEARGEQVALDIALEVRQAVLAVQDAAQAIRVAADRKTYAEQALEETRNLYRNEVVNVDALLQAEVAWQRAQVAYTAALFDGKIAQTVLRQALGEFATWMEERP